MTARCLTGLESFRYAVGSTVMVGRVKAKVVPLLVECRV
jgi:hypothetical protein